MGLTKRLNEFKVRQEQRKEQRKEDGIGKVFHMENPPEQMRDRAERLKSLTNKYGPQLAKRWYTHGCDPKVVGCIVYQSCTVCAYLANVEDFIPHLRRGAELDVVMYREYMDDQLRNIPEGKGTRMALYVCFNGTDGVMTAGVAYIAIDSIEN